MPKNKVFFNFLFLIPKIHNFKIQSNGVTEIEKKTNIHQLGQQSNHGTNR